MHLCILYAPLPRNRSPAHSMHLCKPLPTHPKHIHTQTNWQVCPQTHPTCPSCTFAGPHPLQKCMSAPWQGCPHALHAPPSLPGPAPGCRQPRLCLHTACCMQPCLHTAADQLQAWLGRTDNAGAPNPEKLADAACGNPVCLNSARPLPPNSSFASSTHSMWFHAHNKEEQVTALAMPDPVPAWGAKATKGPFANPKVHL